jgi:hypothetical protein
LGPAICYSQGNAENGFSFTGMYMNDAFHATNQIPQRAVTERLICLYCPLDPTDGGSSERYSFSTRYAATTDAGQLNANAYFIGYRLLAIRVLLPARPQAWVSLWLSVNGMISSSTAPLPGLLSVNSISPTKIPLTATVAAFGTYFNWFRKSPGRSRDLRPLWGSYWAQGDTDRHAIAIGIWGAVILTFLRMVQGIGVGGDWGGSVLLAMEWSRHHGQRGLVASWPQFGVRLVYSSQTFQSWPSALCQEISSPPGAGEYPSRSPSYSSGLVCGFVSAFLKRPCSNNS